MQAAAQYGMEPGEFIKVLDQNGQIPAMVGEVARNKALAVVLGKAKVVDTKGKASTCRPSPPASSRTTTNFVEADAGDHEGHDHEGHDGH